MAVVEVWAWDLGVQLLLDKVTDVDLGVRRPTPDKAYEGDHGN